MDLEGFFAPSHYILDRLEDTAMVDASDHAEESNASKSSKVSADLEVTNSDLLVRLAGPNESNLRILSEDYDAWLSQRGNTIHIQGSEATVAHLRRVLTELLDVLQRGSTLSSAEIQRAAKTLERHPEVKLHDLFADVVLNCFDRKVITPKGLTQQHYIQAMRSNDVVFGVGPAGTGKTYLAVAMAVRALHDRRVKRIVLTRPAVEAGEKLGFLPGDLAEKINPYLRPLYDALHDMLEAEKVQAFIEEGRIDICPLAFMRGRTLNDSFIILDEAQNTSPEQMKMFLTRLGYNAKAVITGDPSQTDLPRHLLSGLGDAASLLGGLPGIGVCHFSRHDVVRHPLVQKIIQAYDERQPSTPP